MGKHTRLENKLLKVLSNQFANQQRIFVMLNSYANNEHLSQWSRIDPEAVIAQVYADLASGFSELRDIVTKLGGEDE